VEERELVPYKDREPVQVLRWVAVLLAGVAADGDICFANKPAKQNPETYISPLFFPSINPSFSK